MVIYVTKDKESEYRFNNWDEVIVYARQRIVAEDLEIEMTNDLNKEDSKR